MEWRTYSQSRTKSVNYLWLDKEKNLKMPKQFSELSKRQQKRRTLLYYNSDRDVASQPVSLPNVDGNPIDAQWGISFVFGSQSSTSLNFRSILIFFFLNWSCLNFKEDCQAGFYKFNLKNLKWRLKSSNFNKVPA